MPNLISHELVVFLKGRNISDNIILAQEFLHSPNKVFATHPLMAIKLDMKRVFDIVNWGYLKAVLFNFGFPINLIEGILACITNHNFVVLVNGSPTETFSLSMGLW